MTRSAARKRNPRRAQDSRSNAGIMPDARIAINGALMCNAQIRGFGCTDLHYTIQN